MFNKIKTNQLIVVGLLIFGLSGCAAVHTSISKRDLDVQTKVSTSIFVAPVPQERRKIYLEVRSAVMEFDRNAFRTSLNQQISQSGNGYTFTDDPDDAQYTMSVFVRQLEKASPSAAENALQSGYSGAGMGAAAAVATGSGYRGAAGGALVGGLMATAADAFVKDVTYLLVADIQIQERAKKGVIVRKDSKVNAKISDDGATTTTYSEASNLKEYRTRVVTTANKANLELAEAQPLMFEKTAYAMSSFF
ncbi:TraT complement resistance protein [Arsukibacterium tuosuense]|uniref:TraT complement resistance protein n=1 Tax=Arsukibacterium tuosuense TaxID=1323745 RepID=A0A285IMW8_9GAMM|nr:TraT complement resistance protein [Arsukibacterium tuosuense]